MIGENVIILNSSTVVGEVFQRYFDSILSVSNRVRVVSVEIRPEPGDATPSYFITVMGREVVRPTKPPIADSLLSLDDEDEEEEEEEHA